MFKQSLAEAVPSPFFSLALDVGRKGLPPALKVMGESVSDVGMAIGTAMLLQGRPDTVTLGIVLLAASVTARVRLKKRKD